MKLLVSALEPSANVHLKYLMEKLPDVEIAGIFDRALGTPLYGMDEFSVMGFVDVLAKYFKGKEAVAEMTQLAGECDKVLLIDAPAFNLPLAKAIKERYPKKEIVYYILPKVWAWKKGRAKKVDRYCDRLASIFPFEKRFYPRAEYVGNPLLDEITLTWRPTEDAETIAFLPGSRKSEITRLMPVFKEVAEALPGRRKVLSIPDFISDEKIAEWYGDISGFDVVRDAQHAVAQAHFAYVCSGTATLETALIGTPFVLVYKARPLDWIIGNAIVKLPYKGLANIIMDFAGREPVHPEIFQNDVTKERLLELYETMDRDRFADGSRELHEILRYGSAENMARLILNRV
ncbi:lipid-A-disaccharide synthase [Hydrogenimonas sp.]|uniref:lipid-A-disaccharide synthase n=1 Tax=Hydrogenimonas sp. TaxID=2231112 RepID=UPI00261A4197|nr:lipid-A-disaccharide synthase [Hydrogenimonas sp.]